MTTLTEIGAYQAKTHLPEFLRKVQAGSGFTITQRGRPVADLVPAGTAVRSNAAQAAGRMRQFVRNHPVVTVDIKALIEDGRD